MTLAQAFQSHNPQIIVIESRARSIQSKADLPQPLFFYHLNRTGGLSFSNPFMLAFDVSYEVLKQKKGGDFDFPNAERVAEVGPDLYQMRGFEFAFVSGHVDFGFHHLLRSPYRLMTVARDPVARMTSEFTSKNMRAGRVPDVKDFPAHFRNPERINLMTKQLHPEAYVADPAGIAPGTLYQRQKEPPVDVGAVRQNLEQNFEAYVTNHDIYPLLQHYAAEFGLPNIVMEKINQTQKGYKIDNTPFVDEIRELNRADVELYEFIEQNPRFPQPLSAAPAELSPQTMILAEVEKHKQSLSEVVCLSTADVLRLLESDPAKFSQLPSFLSL